VAIAIRAVWAAAPGRDHRSITPDEALELLRPAPVYQRLAERELNAVLRRFAQPAHHPAATDGKATR
jgi:hypothetical protein